MVEPVSAGDANDWILDAKESGRINPGEKDMDEFTSGVHDELLRRCIRYLSTKFLLSPETAGE